MGGAQLADHTPLGEIPATVAVTPVATLTSTYSTPTTVPSPLASNPPIPSGLVLTTTSMFSPSNITRTSASTDAPASITVPGQTYGHGLIQQGNTVVVSDTPSLPETIPAYVPPPSESTAIGVPINKMLAAMAPVIQSPLSSAQPDAATITNTSTIDPALLNQPIPTSFTDPNAPTTTSVVPDGSIPPALVVSGANAGSALSGAAPKSTPQVSFSRPAGLGNTLPDTTSVRQELRASAAQTSKAAGPKRI